MALNLLNHNHNKTNTNKLLSKDSRLKKIISVINYLNKSFEKKYDISIYRIHFNSEKLKELYPHHQIDILRVLNSNISKEGYKPTVIRTLREDLRFLIHIKAIEKKILTFSNNLGKFKGKLCIYKVSPIAYKLISAYFEAYKADLYRKIKKSKDGLDTQNVTKNVTVYINYHKNIYNKNSIETIFKKSYTKKKTKKKNKKEFTKNNLEKRLKLPEEITKEIISIAKKTKNPDKTYKNTLFNYKDFLNYLSYDYKKEDISYFFLSKLKEYKNKIHFMRKYAPYKTDFYLLAGEFKDSYHSKWKTNKKTNFSGHVKEIANNILSKILEKELKFE
ncbi:plasmid maintenance protein [Borreliella burgdorferi]|uniref:plasmid maintenance protein n=2 Tax=Borreliella burgdorferi TaxID=139 RepID=UPI000D024D4D|nr:plasmid maintenance protein [Borreliella burgdorferi]MCD2383384.1 plasmid maintenance protein [Borreliella burgdorferi]MCD2389660.1 plasmid maintenance protein [Borreliella burgdorferi]MCD2394172.1 plasmid maintenance protein [Borreliella burgdorferi]MCD2395763.1 plasmid maintenance protein [Borreliella burgdorferi]MCD2396758.1 plasmid maintenance protein [Borreliella burgdorferi]